MYDLKIIGGLIFDGKGNKPFKADIAIQDGIIIEVGECKLDSKEKIIANNYIITPGFIDLHTHYDGQISWDEELKPSVNHGVTTAILGNCGVGFAPCRESDRSKLINLMEGVEDIPGTALHEGITWEWETFPEYMNAIDALPHTIDFAVMVPHDPLRVYVMGERAVSNEPATKIDISQMKQLTRDALEAGAIGFSIGRSDFHKSSKGEWTPGSEAGKSELIGIASAFRGLKHGVLQAVNDFDMYVGISAGAFLAAPLSSALPSCSSYCGCSKSPGVGCRGSMWMGPEAWIARVRRLAVSAPRERAARLCTQNASGCGDAPFAARARLGTHVPAAHAFPQRRRQAGRHHILSVECLQRDTALVLIGQREWWLAASL